MVHNVVVVKPRHNSPPFTASESGYQYRKVKESRKGEGLTLSFIVLRSTGHHPVRVYAGAFPRGGKRKNESIEKSGINECALGQ